jgi:5-methylcytosine-specific restriction enzyme A
MPPLDARRLAESLVGESLRTPTRENLNQVLRVERGNAIVATDESPDGEPVSLAHLQHGLDLLTETGEVRITPETFNGYRRSSAIGAMLATIPSTVLAGPPTFVRLSRTAPLRDQLEQACALVRQTRITPNVAAADPLQQLMVHSLKRTVRALAAGNRSYKVQGSAGQQNFPWAETPWLAIFDRLVTESAQHGHYVVFLIHPRGEGVYLSLNQAVTEVRAVPGADYHGRLLAQAARFRSYIPAWGLDGLIVEPIDLAGRGHRTRGYESANIAAAYLPADRIPHDAVIATLIRRFLDLYETATVGLDEDEAAVSVDVADDARTGTESKRYRWHLRAEGRNRTIVRRAKEIRDYTCQACGRRFVDELGEIGKRCIDAHHLTPFGELDARPRDLDAKTDFAVVCANCHRLLHSETPPLGVRKLQQLLVAVRVEPTAAPDVTS